MTKRKNRTHNQWQALIDEQHSSGQSAAAFCRQKRINPKYFSKRKTDHLRSSNRSKASPSFIQARPPTQTTQTDIVLKYQDVCLHIPSSLGTLWVADLLKVLA